MNWEEKENYLILHLGFHYIAHCHSGKKFQQGCAALAAGAVKRNMYILVASEFHFMKLIPKTAATC